MSRRPSTRAKTPKTPPAEPTPADRDLAARDALIAWCAAAPGRTWSVSQDDGGVYLVWLNEPGESVRGSSLDFAAAASAALALTERTT